MHKVLDIAKQKQYHESLENIVIWYMRNIGRFYEKNCQLTKKVNWISLKNKVI